MTTSVVVPVLVSAAVPTTPLPSKKVTVPAGVPNPGASAVTVALRLTEEPKLEVVGAVNCVFVEEAETFSVTVALDPAKLVGELDG